MTAWPGVVDQGDLDARPVNAIPALGVVTALVLTVAATRVRGARLAPRRPLDLVRVALAVVVVALSLPWIAAELGFFFPEGVFITRRPVADATGTVLPAVHLGQHHGLDGALIVLSGLVVSRVRPAGRRLGVAISLYAGLMLGYGAMNLANDVWDEQVVKRGWTDWAIPSSLEPRVAPVWLVTLALSAGAAACLRREARAGSRPVVLRPSYSAAWPRRR